MTSCSDIVANDACEHQTLQDSKGRFRNPWPSWDDSNFSVARVLRWKREPKLTMLPSSQSELDITLPVLRPDFSAWGSDAHNSTKACWIGHATVLVRIGGLTVLTDPVFADRCTPLKPFGHKRYRSPPCAVQDLPCPDLVLISHNHYDHLCLRTCRQLHSTFGQRIRWCVPSGLASWLTAHVGVAAAEVIELRWWQTRQVAVGGGETAEVVCLPCQHWSMRGPLIDKNRSLWASWAVISGAKRFYFGGDTGYCAAFSAIGRSYGPFDLAAIPIGCYAPRWFMAPQHCDPTEAVQIHVDISAKRSVGIHWGTFDMGSTEFYLEPKSALCSAVAAAALDPQSFTTQTHGQIVHY